jgi:HEAT repeat protein
VRLYAVQALSELKATAALDAIVQRLHDPNGDIRLAAAAAIGNIGDPNAIAILTQALQDHYFGVRLAAVESLGRLGDPAAVAILIERLRDSNSKVRAAAAASLGKFENLEARVALVETLADPDAAVRDAVLEALALHGLNLGEFFQMPGAVAERSLVELLPQNEPLVARALIVALAHPQPQVRQNAALALTRSNIPAAREALIAMAGGWRLSDRIVATRTLLAGDGGSTVYDLARVLIQPASLLYLCFLIAFCWLCFRFVLARIPGFKRSYPGGSGRVV